MAGRLQGKTVAVLATDGFEQVELTKPVEALRAEGAEVRIVSPKGDEIQGYNHHDKGDTVRVDQTLDQVSAQEFDALVLPGGALNPDQLRTEQKALDFVRGFFRAGKPVGATCHAPWILIDAGVVDGRTLTSWPSIRTDLRNAGAKVVDQEVVVDEGLVTSRMPDDIPAFNAKLIEEIAEGVHSGQRAGSADVAQGDPLNIQ
jgi:protease I